MVCINFVFPQRSHYTSSFQQKSRDSFICLFNLKSIYSPLAHCRIPDRRVRIQVAYLYFPLAVVTPRSFPHPPKLDELLQHVPTTLSLYSSGFNGRYRKLACAHTVETDELEMATQDALKFLHYPRYTHWSALDQEES